EERAGLDKRYFRSRSIVNAALEDEGFLEHDLTLQYRREEGANWRFIGGFSMSASEMNSGTRSTDTLRYFQNYSAHYRGSNIDIIGAAVIQHFHFVPRKWYTTAFAGSISCKRSISVWVSEAELTFGSSLNAKVIQDRDALIFGVRKQEQFPINTGLKILRQVTPLIEAASYWYDLEESGNFDTQIRGGVTLGFAKNNALQLRNTFGTILRMQEKETNVRRYRFDSEVVVIF
ncbi:MAG: hypothetical protein LBB56_04220, partial [Chitinispirillales bacterium]|nr:hypothetical protein [Chitinispirillales bacterium]